MRNVMTFLMANATPKYDKKNDPVIQKESTAAFELMVKRTFSSKSKQQDHNNAENKIPLN